MSSARLLQLHPDATMTWQGPRVELHLPGRRQTYQLEADLIPLLRQFTTPLSMEDGAQAFLERFDAESLTPTDFGQVMSVALELERFGLLIDTRPATRTTEADQAKKSVNLRAELQQLAGPPIFIVGHPRSGTTLTYDLLSAHPLVAGVLESYIFLGMTDFLDDSHWSRQAQPNRPHGLGQLISPEQAISDLGDLACKWLSHSLEPHHRYLVEKTPAHVGRMALIDAIFPTCRFIHVIRDGRDAAASMVQAAASGIVEPIHADPTWDPHTASNHIKACARSWPAHVQAGQAMAETLGDRYTEVRYEALCAEPAEHLAWLFEFCGIPTTEAEVTSIIEAVGVKDDAAGVGARPWATWSRDDKQAFDIGAGETLRRLGYDTGLVDGPRA